MMEDEKTDELYDLLKFKVELFETPEDCGQAVFKFFLVEGDNYDLRSFIEEFKNRILYSFEKIDSKKLPD